MNLDFRHLGAPTDSSPPHSGGDQIDDGVWAVLDSENPFVAAWQGIVITPPLPQLGWAEIVNALTVMAPYRLVEWQIEAEELARTAMIGGYRSQHWRIDVAAQDALQDHMHAAIEGRADNEINQPDRWIVPAVCDAEHFSPQHVLTDHRQLVARPQHPGNGRFSRPTVAAQNDEHRAR